MNLWLQPCRALLNVALALAASFVLHSADSPSEYQVKAAYLLNFTRFIEWPSSAFEEPASPLTVCILGDDPLGEALDQLVRGENVSGRRIEVRRIQHLPSPKACQIVYSADAAQTLRSLSGPVLTVADDAKSGSGAIISFTLDKRRVRFNVNLKAAASSGLGISSKLLRVAKEVER